MANELLRWAETDVRRVRWSDDRKEVVVIASHREAGDDPQAVMHARWWLTGGPGGWRVYDFEDLDIGARVSQMMALTATPEFVREYQADPAGVQDRMATVRTAAAALFQRKDTDGADAALARVRGRNLPAPVAALRELVEAGLRLEKGLPAEALERLDAADRHMPGMPVVKVLRAAALNQTGRHAEALDMARAYMAELGPGSIPLLNEGAALEGLGRKAEAAEAYRKSLDDAPDEVAALDGLRRVLPAGGKAELTDRLARSRSPGDLYTELIELARAGNDREGAAALTAGLRKVRPNDPRLDQNEVRARVADGKYAEAAAEVRRDLTGVEPGEELPDSVRSYLDAMAGVGLPLEALAAVPGDHAGRAFRHLGSYLEDDLYDEPDEADSPGRQLDRLIRARRKQAPGDPWLWYYEGAILAAKKDYTGAAKAFGRGAAALKDWPEPADDEERDAFRSEQVHCLYEAKQGLKAYAEVGPADKTFRQLAWRYNGANDPTGLAALVAAHEKRFPEDATLPFWRADVQYLKGEYAAAAAGFKEYREGGDESERYWATDRELRSLVRAGKAAEAARVVADLGPDKVSRTLRAVVAAAAGDVPGVERLLAEQNDEAGGVFSFYYDEDFTRLIAKPAFAGLRKKYPDPRSKKPNATD